MRLGSAHSIPRISLTRDEALGSGEWRRRCPSRGRCAGRQGLSASSYCLRPLAHASVSGRGQARPGPGPGASARATNKTLSLAFASLQHSRHQHHGPSLPSRRHMDGSGWPVSYTPSHRAMMPVPWLRCLPPPHSAPQPKQQLATDRRPRADAVAPLLPRHRAPKGRHGNILTSGKSLHCLCHTRIRSRSYIQ